MDAGLKARHFTNICLSSGTPSASYTAARLPPRCHPWRGVLAACLPNAAAGAAWDVESGGLALDARGHGRDGYNIGTPPNGYAASRVPHPAPAKAAQGRTKTRLVPDPERAPVVARIYQWRITGPKTRVCSFGLRARHSVAGHCLILRSNPRSS